MYVFPASPLRKEETPQPQRPPLLLSGASVLNKPKASGLLTMRSVHGPQVFLNLVLDEATEQKEGGEKSRLGMCVIRGNQVSVIDALDRIGGGGGGGGGDFHRGGR